MDRADYRTLRRFEPGWLLAGLGWGVFLGIATSTVPLLLAWGVFDGVPDPDALLLPLLWVLVLGMSGASYGGVVGMVVGLAVMLVVGRDPEVRSARRTPATVALLVIPVVVLVVMWWG